MSIHTFRNDWQVWLLNASFVPQKRIETELLDFRLDWRKRDECSFTCSIPLSSQFYPLLDSTADQFLLVGRLSRWQVFCIESLELAYNPRSGQKDLAQLAGKGGNAYFLDTRICAPNAVSGEEIGQQFTGKLDDVIKDFVRYNLVVGTAPNDPLGNPRGLAGLTVAANKSEHAVTATIFRQGMLWEALKQLAQTSDIDMAWTPVWNGANAAVTFTFETYVPTRGTDRSVGQPEPVILSEVYQVFSKSSWHCNNYPMRTHGYLNDGLSVIENPDATGRVRKETILNTDDITEVKEALEDMRPEQGHTFDFVESGAFQLGRDFWLGDIVPHYDSKLNTPIKVEQLTGIKISIEQDGIGSEKIELTFGDEKPTSTKNQGGGGARRRLPTGEGEPSVSPWAAASKIKPVASSNLAGTALAIPRGDHQHRAVLIGDDAGVVGPSNMGASWITGGTGIRTRTDPETNSMIIDGIGSALWGLRDDALTLVSPAADSTIKITGNTGYTVTAGTAVLTVLGPWYRDVVGVPFVRPRTLGDALQIHDAGGGLAFHVTGNGDVIGNAQNAGGAANRYMDIKDYDICTAADGVISGVHNIIFSGNLISEVSTTASIIAFLGGSDGEDQLRSRNLNVYDTSVAADANLIAYIRNGLGLTLFKAHDLTMYADAGSTLKAQIDGATGDFYLADLATTHLGGYTYTWPTTGAVTGEYLKATVVGAAITLSWEDPTGGYSPHDPVTLDANLAANLLGLSTQQLTLDVQNANLVFAGPASGAAAAPTFRAPVADDLGSGKGEGYILKTTALGVTSWDKVENVLVTPGTLTVSTTNSATGNHTHAITTSANPGVAASILATDASGNVAVQQLTCTRLQFSAGEYIDLAAANRVEIVADGYIYQYIGAALTTFTYAANFVPGSNNAISNGNASYRWSNVFTVLLDHSGTTAKFRGIEYTLPSADAAGVLTSNGAGLLGWTGPAYATHVHSYSKADAYTGNWETYGSPDYSSNPVRKTDGTPLYYDATGHITTTPGTGMAIGSTPHKHPLSYTATDSGVAK